MRGPMALITVQYATVTGTPKRATKTKYTSQLMLDTLTKGTKRSSTAGVSSTRAARW